MGRGSTFWAIVLILAGVLLLFDSLGLLAINAWSIIWPLFLVLLGLWILWGALSPRRSRAMQEAQIPLEGAARADVTIRHGAGRLSVAGGADPARLVEGAFNGGVEYRARREGDELRVEMKPPDNAWGTPWSWDGSKSLDWNVKLNDSVPLRLVFETGAGESRLDLTNLRVTDLTVKTGASSSEIDLPANAGFTRVKVEAGAAGVSLHVPAGAAARIHAGGGLAGIEVDTARFPASGGFYISPDYETAGNKIEIDAQVGVGSFKVR